MVRSTTPTRRPPSSAAASICRVRHSVDACSPPTRQANGLPSVVRPSLPITVVSSRGGGARRRRECACSPTTHPGSFRCALHRSSSPAHRPSSGAAATCGGLQGDARRSAMANSLVRIAAVVGGDHVRRALAALIRPSSHHQRRRAAFLPRPSRLSAMSAATACASLL